MLDVAAEFNGTYAIPTASLLYSIQVEFRKTTGVGMLTMKWSSSSQAKVVVPQSNLFSSAAHISGSPFLITVVA